MKLAVIGSRTYDDYATVKLYLDKINKKVKGNLIIVSGGAKGADSLGEQYANENNLDTLIFLPDYKQYGRSAPFVRNKLIIENCDKVIAFWDGKSKGTKHSLDIAEKMGKEILIIS